VSVEIQSILSQNITIVYESLELRFIDNSKLKNLLDEKTRPTVMDTPEMIVAVYPPDPIIIQIGCDRVRITLPRNAESIGSVPLWEIANKCDQLVSQGKYFPIAFGFNYDVALTSKTDNTHKMLKDLFIPDIEAVNTKIDGHLLAIVPRLIFTRNDTRYDLILESVDDYRIKAHLNAHFVHKDKPLPSKDELELAFREEYNFFFMMLTRLL